MPGLANRLVGKRVQAAAVNFPAAAAWFNNCEVTGIPVRPRFFTIEPPAGSAPHLLVFGGSLGARIFNVNLPAIMPALLNAVPGLTVLHQCGARHLESTKAGLSRERRRSCALAGLSVLRRHACALCRRAPGSLAQRGLHSGRTGRGRKAGPAGPLCRRRRSSPAAQCRGHGRCRRRRHAPGEGYRRPRQATGRARRLLTVPLVSRTMSAPREPRPIPPPPSASPTASRLAAEHRPVSCLEIHRRTEIAS